MSTFDLPQSNIAAHLPHSISTFYEIMDILDKRLNDKGKNWRHVLKSLKVLDYCLHEGSEHVVTWSRKNIYIIRTLREFQHIDEDGRDVGQNSEWAFFSEMHVVSLTIGPSPSLCKRTNIINPGRGEASY